MIKYIKRKSKSNGRQGRQAAEFVQWKVLRCSNWGKVIKTMKERWRERGRGRRGEEIV